MNTSNSAVQKIGFLCTGAILLTVVSGGGPAGAETFQHGGSTATINQSGGHGASQSQVLRSEDGQTIITQDGSSTDITVQSGGGALPPDSSGERSGSGADPFERRWIEKRFSHPPPGGGRADDCSVCPAASGREEFKQRLLERMRRPVQ